MKYDLKIGLSIIIMLWITGCSGLSVQKQPNLSAEDYINQGKVLYDQSNYQEAVKHFEKAIQIKQDHAMAYVNLGHACCKLNQYNKAIEAYQQAKYYNIELTDQADEWITKAMLNQGRIEAAMEHQFDTLFKSPEEFKGNMADRIAYLRKVIQFDPKNSPALLEMGNLLRFQGKFEQAVLIYEKALHVSPENTLATLELGRTLEILDRHDEAMMHYRDANTYSPKNPEILKRMGDIYFTKKNYEKAITCFKQAILFDPNNAALYENLGDVYIQQENFHEAIGIFQEAVRINPELSSAYISLGLAYVMKGNEKESPESFKKAMENYQKAQSINNKYPFYTYLEYEALNNWGVVLCQQGQFKMAVDKFKQAIKKDSEFGDGYLFLGHSQRFCGLYQDAIENYIRAINISPEHILGQMKGDPKNMLPNGFNISLMTEFEKKQLSEAYLLPLRFMVITSLIYQGHRAEAFKTLKSFINNMKEISAGEKIQWRFDGFRKYITRTDKFNPPDKTLLEKLIVLLNAEKRDTAPLIQEVVSMYPEFAYQGRDY